MDKAIAYNLSDFYFKDNFCAIGSIGCALIIKDAYEIKKLKNFYFINNFATFGGAIFILQSYQPLLPYEDFYNFTFEHNIATKGGGGIYVYGDFSFKNLSGFLFLENIAQQGGGIYINGFPYNFQSEIDDFQFMVNSSFIRNQAQIGGGMCLLNNFEIKNPLSIYEEKLILQNVQFIENKALKNAGAIMLASQGSDQNIIFKIQQSLFQGNEAANGGAIQITVFSGNLDVILNQTIFKENKAIYSVSVGGVIGLFSIKTLQSIGCQFLNNQAYQGGAIYVQPIGNYQIQKLANLTALNNKLVTFFQQNQFIQNEAYIGGAIYINYVQSNVQVVRFLGYQYYQDKKQYNINFNNNTFIKNHAKISGAAIRLNGISVNTNVSEYSIDCKLLRAEFKLNKNIFKQNTVEDPGKYISENEDDILCSCISGEYLVEGSGVINYYCTQCPFGQFRDYRQFDTFLACQGCPEGVICPGGQDQLILKENFWSQTEQQLLDGQVYQCNINYKYYQGNLFTNLCVNQSKCVYSSQCYEKSFKGKFLNGKWCCTLQTNCILGNLGPLCLACDNENGFFGEKGSCSKCLPKWIIILELIFYSLFIVILLIITIVGTQKTQNTQVISKILRKLFGRTVIVQQQLNSSLIKILTMFIISISFIQQIVVDRPEFLEPLFSFITSLGTITGYLVSSFECLVPSNYISSLVNRKQFLILLEFIIQVGGILFLVLILLIINLIKRKKSYFEIKPSLGKHMVTGSSYIFIFMQPQLIQSSIQLLTCEKIAGQSYLTTNLLVECTSENYAKSIQMGIPILVFQILFPLIIFVTLFIKKRQNKIDKEKLNSFSRNFSYFYMDYSSECYYWEFVRMMQRIFIIAFIVIFQNQQTIVGLLMLLVLASYGLMVHHFQPNETKYIQKLEIISCFVQIISILLILTSIEIQILGYFLAVITILILLDLAFIIKTISKIVSYFYIQLIFELYLRDQTLLRFQFIKKVIDKKKKQNKAQNQWKIARQFVHKLAIFLLKNPQKLLDPFQVNSLELKTIIGQNSLISKPTSELYRSLKEDKSSSLYETLLSNQDPQN